MGIIVDVGVRGVSLPCAAEAIVEGYVYKDDGSGRMTAHASVTDVPVAIALESSLDVQLGTAKTLTAGDEMPFAMMGSGMVVGVASENAITYQTHAAVYGAQTASTNGYCDSSNGNSAVKIGHYMGKDAYATTTAGELIPVRLDVAPTA